MRMSRRFPPQLRDPGDLRIPSHVPTGQGQRLMSLFANKSEIQTSVTVLISSGKMRKKGSVTKFDYLCVL